ncbi:FAD-binding domain-containing protein [Nemania diffusa]|nr:FAD-binding domain-containing protein [Nemania diffusa]
MPVMAAPTKILLLLALIWADYATALLSEELVNIVVGTSGPQALLDSITESANLIDHTASLSYTISGSETEWRAATACKVVALVLESHQVYQSPSAQLYEDEEVLNWSTTCWLAANCFIRPQNAVEVALILSIVKTTGAKFAVRSGGHNPNPGFASIESDGVLIDLQDLKLLSIDPEGILSAGPGHRWIELYNFSEDHGRTVKGGRTADVGIPGFLLGGGMPYFPSIHGLGADSIINYELVLPNSTLIHANAQQNQDIYSALKGGGSNFGIVTRFDLETYPLLRAQYVVNLYNASDYVNIFAATVKLQRFMELDPKIDAYVTMTPTVAVVGMFYADWLAERPAAFEAFYELGSLIGPMVPLTNGMVASLAADLQEHTPMYNARRYIAAATTLVDSGLYLENHRHFLQVLENSKTSLAANMSYTIQPVASATVRQGNDQRGNTLGLEEVPQTWWSMVVEWAEQVDDGMAHDTLHGLLGALDRLAEDRHLLMEFRFMNDANLEQDVLGSYGTANLGRLRSAADASDPERLLQTLQNDGFLLRGL